jgi:hypothetical protein
VTLVEDDNVIQQFPAHASHAYAGDYCERLGAIPQQCPGR